MTQQCLRVSLAAMTVALATAIAPAQVAEIAAADESIVLRLTEPSPQSVAVFTATVFETDDAARARPAVWSGVPKRRSPRSRAGRAIVLPRFDGPVDRLYQRFLLTDDAGKPLGAAHYVTDLSSLSREAGTLPQPESPKGLQCIVDLDDAIDLGVKHAAVNVSLSQLYDDRGSSSIRRDVDGVPVAVHESAIRHLDATVKRMTDAGIRVTFILLNYQRSSGAAKSPLVHPQTDSAAPNGIGAFNLTDEEGVRTYRGLIELLAERYSRPDAAYGLVANYIVGNEIQSHFDWYNLGDAPPETVVAEYAKAVRIADLAVRRFQPDARAFVSLDHNWSRQHRAEATRSMPGRVLLDRLHAALGTHGDVPWGVAFHPYPENLGNPRTWQDTTAKLCIDTPRITFKNLEVLTEYLRRPPLLFDGKPRRLILSEQGFHCLTTDDGESLQAAAYAFAYERVRRIEGIESFIYHRHVDHPHEGGLRLGLYENVPGTTDKADHPRRVVDVFRSIDSPGGVGQAEFAKAIIGIDSWDELAPRPVKIECE